MASKQVLRSSLLFVVVLGLVGACDPSALPDVKKEGDKAGDKQAGDAKAEEPAAEAGDAKAGESAAGAGEAGEAAATAGEVAAAPETLEGCQAQCEQAILSDDDRATCRLRCKNVHGWDAGVGNPTVGAFLGCYDGCAAKSPTNRASCHKNCAASVTAGTGDPAATACPRACVETLGSCLAPCEGKGEDDKATCRKQCEAVASKCVGACG